MELVKTHLGQTAFITNVPSFAAATVLDGSMLVSGASTTAQGATVTVALDTTDGQNFIGVTQVSSSFASASKENLANNSHAFQIDTDGIPNQGTVGGMDFLPICINPNASYMAQYATTTAAGTASANVGTWTAGTTTAATRGTTGLHVLGGWLFSLAGANSAGATPTFSGSLRYISNQSSTVALTLLTAMNISTDSHMIWADRTWKKGGSLNATADLLRSQSGSTGTGLHLNGAKMLGIENYIGHDSAPLHPLRQWVDDGNDGLTGVRIYKELVFTAPFIVSTEITA